MKLTQYSPFYKGILLTLGACILNNDTQAATKSRKMGQPQQTASVNIPGQGPTSAFAPLPSGLPPAQFPQTNPSGYGPQRPSSAFPNSSAPWNGPASSPFPQMAYTEGSQTPTYPAGTPTSYPPNNGPDAGMKPDDITVVFEGDKSSDSGNSETKLDKGDQISVDFLKEDIKQVLRYIAELYDLNIVIPENLEGAVSLRLRDTTWESVLEAVLSPVGCTYVKYKNIIQVRKLEDMDKEPVQTDSFLLKHSEAKKVAEELKDMVDANNGGRIAFNERSNILIVTDRPKRIKVLAELIQKLDQPEKQVMIEAKFLEVSNTDTKNIGLKWSQTMDFGIQPPSGSPLRAYTRTREDGKEIVKKLDDKLNFTASGLSTSINLTDTNTLGRVLSNPTIVTMNNVPAEINVGQKYPVPKYTYSEEQGRFSISGFDEKDIGISLKVTPTVQDEFITLKLEPKLTSKDDVIKFEGGTSVAASIPLIGQKAVTSTVTIRSGYTIVIGGLISETLAKGSQKVPGLGGLPIIGLLFSQKDSKAELKNLLIFLTATQIAYDGQRAYDTPFYGVKNANPNQMYQMGVTDQQLPGYRYSPQEEARFDEVQRLRSKVEQAMMNKTVNQDVVKAKQAADEVNVSGDVNLKAKKRGRRR